MDWTAELVFRELHRKGEAASQNKKARASRTPPTDEKHAMRAGHVKDGADDQTGETVGI